MQVNFTSLVILNGAVIVLGFFVAFVLLFKRENPLANRLMSLFLFAISLWLCDNFMHIAGIYNQNSNYYFKPIYYSFSFGPLVYFYVRSIVNSNFKFQKADLIHFIPVVIQATLYIYLSFRNYEFRHWYWQEVHLPYTYRIEFDGTFISMTIYIFISIKLLRDYRIWLKNEHSDHSSKNLNWLNAILILMFLLCIQWFLEVVLRDVYEMYYNYKYTPAILGVITLILAFRAFFQEDQKDVVFEPLKAKSQKSDFQFDQNTLDQINKRMDINKDFLDPKLNLKEFAFRCKLPKKTVSLYLNQKLNKSFHDYINGFRIEEFKTRVLKPEERHMTIEGLAYDCGFNSKATFNRIFKKNIGITPTEFVSKHA